MAGDAEKLIRNIPIENYVQKFVPLKRKGGNFWGLCPFHSEKSPSFSVSSDRGIFKCFGCGKGGNVITFVKEYHRVDFPEALKILAEYSGIPLEERGGDYRKEKEKETFAYDVLKWISEQYQKMLPDSAALKYLKSRNVSNEAIAHFQLGYANDSFRFLETKLSERYRDSAPLQAKAIQVCYESGLLAKSRESEDAYNRFRDRLIFPITDTRGRVSAFGGRILEPKENTAKYINSPESPFFHKKSNLFHLCEAKEDIRKTGYAILVEGYFDVLGLYERGLANSVAPLGTAFTDEQAKLLKRYTDKVILFFDSDDAGTEAAFKSLHIARKNSLEARVIMQTGLEKKSDPFDLSRSLSGEEIKDLISQSADEIGFTLWYFFRYKYSVSEIRQKQKGLTELFAIVRDLVTDTEKDEYLRKASEFLEIDRKILQKDFMGEKLSTHDKALGRPDMQIARVKVAHAQKFEKEILSLLLRFPENWKDESWLLQIPWRSESAYLLFSFFRDRLKAGEFWDWDHLAEAMHLMSPDLASLMADILSDYSDIYKKLFEEENKDQLVRTSARPSLSEEIKKKFQTLVMRFILLDIDEKIKKLQEKLNSAENIAGEEAEEIMIEITDQLQRKNHINKLIHSG